MNLTKIKQSIERNKSIGLIIMLVSCIMGYAFFLLSPIIFPGSSVVTPSPFYSDLDCQDGNRIRLIRSDYSAASSTLQYEFDIKGELLKPYEFIIKYRTKNSSVHECKVKPIMREGDIYVINAENVSPKFTEIQVEVVGDIDGKNGTVVKLFTNKSSINNVDSINEKSAKEYKTDRANFRISEYNNLISELKDKINSINNEIDLQRNLNKQLEERLKHETPDEQNITNEKIKSNVSIIAKYEEEINLTNKSIQEYELKIQKANELIDELN